MSEELSELTLEGRLRIAASAPGATQLDWPSATIEQRLDHLLSQAAVTDFLALPIEQREKVFLTRITGEIACIDGEIVSADNEVVQLRGEVAALEREIEALNREPAIAGIRTVSAQVEEADTRITAARQNARLLISLAGQFGEMA